MINCAQRDYCKSMIHALKFVKSAFLYFEIGQIIKGWPFVEIFLVKYNKGPYAKVFGRIPVSLNLRLICEISVEYRSTKQTFLGLW